MIIGVPRRERVEELKIIMKAIIETILICTNWLVLVNVAKEMRILIYGG